ncbi:hypothetical protein THAOC_19532, partial [Thalassiosira oceanica]
RGRHAGQDAHLDEAAPSRRVLVEARVRPPGPVHGGPERPLRHVVGRRDEPPVLEPAREVPDEEPRAGRSVGYDDAPDAEVPPRVFRRPAEPPLAPLPDRVRHLPLDVGVEAPLPLALGDDVPDGEPPRRQRLELLGVADHVFVAQMTVEVGVRLARLGADGGRAAEAEGVPGDVPEGVERVAVHLAPGEALDRRVRPEDEGVDRRAAAKLLGFAAVGRRGGEGRGVGVPPRAAARRRRDVAPPGGLQAEAAGPPGPGRRGGRSRRAGCRPLLLLGRRRLRLRVCLPPGSPGSPRGGRVGLLGGAADLGGEVPRGRPSAAAAAHL